jgi:hypothetical protein
VAGNEVRLFGYVVKPTKDDPRISSRTPVGERLHASTLSTHGYRASKLAHSSLRQLLGASTSMRGVHARLDLHFARARTPLALIGAFQLAGSEIHLAQLSNIDSAATSISMRTVVTARTKPGDEMKRAEAQEELMTSEVTSTFACSRARAFDSERDHRNKKFKTASDYVIGAVIRA